ncbi:MAG TPA: alpha/beta hydrolase-fold protein [Xanthomonadales bacterium]|nr:alpha/beta hydrolase-fold protein [Xanthomonadales bacterium]
MSYLKLACLYFCLVFSTLLEADDLVLESMQSIRDVQHHKLDSEILERPFHLLIKLPPGATDCSECRFPTVFLLDGGATFSTLAGYSNYLWHEEAVSEFILVGISYGGETFEEGNYRSTDYTAPSEEREYWGGAENFQRVLAEEILPVVSAKYPVDPAHRIIFGQSLGGQFILYTAMTQPGLFYGHISSNPALHRNLDFFLQDRDGEGSTKLFVAVGSNDSPRFKPYSEQWIAHWQAKPDAPFELNAHELPGYGHFSILPESFRLGLMWLLDK